MRQTPPVLGEASTSVEPGDGALDHPAAGQQEDEAWGVGPFDDLDGEPIEMRNGRFELLPGIAAIGEEAGQRRICVAAALDEAWCAIAVLNVGRMNQSVEHVADCVGHDVALAPPLRLPACGSRSGQA